MSDSILLTIEGEVENPVRLTFADLAAFDEKWQVRDVSRVTPDRKGDAIRLPGLLELARPRANANYLGLHASTDDFHASIPLDEVRQSALLIYQIDGAALVRQAGGPLRFFIPDHASCQAAEIDECANVKFVDRIEFTCGKGYDNRPQDDAQHEALHRQQEQKG